MPSFWTRKGSTGRGLCPADGWRVPFEQRRSNLCVNCVGGSNGQRALVLNGFLKEIGRKEVRRGQSVYVTTEHLTTERRRIDILIDTPRELIAVENLCAEIDRVLADLGLRANQSNHWPSWAGASPQDWTTEDIAAATVRTDGRPETDVGIRKMIADLVQLGAALDSIFPSPSP